VLPAPRRRISSDTTLVSAVIINELGCPRLSRPGRKLELDATQLTEAIENRFGQA
jgi:hypothetical protein